MPILIVKGKKDIDGRIRSIIWDLESVGKAGISLVRDLRDWGYARTEVEAWLKGAGLDDTLARGLTSTVYGDRKAE